MRYLANDLRRIVNCRWWRWLTIWFTASPYTLISYRLDRFGFLIFKTPWGVIRLLFFPLFLLFHLLGVHNEIHYSADIGEGLLILHGNLGVVINGHAIAGKNLTLTGGNCIGGRKRLERGDLVLGHDVSLGANAVVLGPVSVGNQVQIGAGSVVIHDAPDHCILVGVPARIVPS